MTWTYYQVNKALTLDATKQQWIDLGINTDVCMTRPDTCGAAGGAISLWLNVNDCPFGGIVSSDFHPSTTSAIYCLNDHIWYDTHTFTNIPTQVRKVL